MIGDPLAVAVAFCPEIVLKRYEKPCFIEIEGKYTKGMVVINWHWTRKEIEQKKTRIISKIDQQAVIDMLFEA